MQNLRKITPMANYTLSNEALNDLQEIWFFGASRWGIKQADNYTLKIDEMCEFIFENRGLGRDKTEVFEGLKSYPVGSHNIFYIEQGKHILVVRILHQKMDYEQHLLN